MNLEKVVWALWALLGATIVYAMDWQREQDQRMSGLDKMLEKQEAILEMQQKYQVRELQAKPVYGYSNAPFFFMPESDDGKAVSPLQPE